MLKLDLSGPDSDSRRLGSLARLSILADTLHAEAERERRLQDEDYLARQSELYRLAESLVRTTTPPKASSEKSAGISDASPEISSRSRRG